jgi:hypothetical protein
LGFTFFSSLYFSLVFGGGLSRGNLVACCPLDTPYIPNHMAGAGAAGVLELPEGWAGLKEIIVET